jgi:hypothetical protein
MTSRMSMKKLMSGRQKSNARPMANPSVRALVDYLALRFHSQDPAASGLRAKGRVPSAWLAEVRPNERIGWGRVWPRIDDLHVRDVRVADGYPRPVSNESVDPASAGCHDDHIDTLRRASSRSFGGGEPDNLPEGRGLLEHHSSPVWATPTSR